MYHENKQSPFNPHIQPQMSTTPQKNDHRLNLTGPHCHKKKMESHILTTLNRANIFWHASHVLTFRKKIAARSAYTRNNPYSTPRHARLYRETILYTIEASRAIFTWTAHASHQTVGSSYSLWLISGLALTRGIHGKCGGKFVRMFMDDISTAQFSDSSRRGLRRRVWLPGFCRAIVRRAARNGIYKSGGGRGKRTLGSIN